MINQKYLIIDEVGEKFIIIFTDLVESDNNFIVSAISNETQINISLVFSMHGLQHSIYPTRLSSRESIIFSFTLPNGEKIENRFIRFSELDLQFIE
jgi:hypothetical protein